MADADDLADMETKLKIYTLITNRYKDIIAEKERRSVSELRQRTSPYNDFVKKLREPLIQDLKPYEYGKHFFIATQRAINYIRQIRNIELRLTFWMSFEEIDELKAADTMDKAILLTALLRSLGSEDAKVYVTRSQRVYVGFKWEGISYLVDPKTGSLLGGPDADNAFLKDPLSYIFSDLHFENFED
jgi:hypothetical protein